MGTGKTGSGSCLACARPDPTKLTEGSPVSLVGSGIAIEDWIWILSCLCPTSPHFDPQMRLFKTRLPLGFCQDCSCRLETGPDDETKYELESNVIESMKYARMSSNL